MNRLPSPIPNERRRVVNTAPSARRAYATWCVSWLPASAHFGVRVETTVYELTAAAAIAKARKTFLSARYGREFRADLFEAG